MIDRRKQFLDELEQLTARHAAALTSAELATLLDEWAAYLCSSGACSSGADPSATLTPDATTPDGLTLTLRFELALTLERELPNLIEVGGIVVPVEPAPALLTELTLRIEGAGIEGARIEGAGIEGAGIEGAGIETPDNAVELRSRVVHVGPRGVALEIIRPTEGQRLALTRLPALMREARAAARSAPQAPPVVHAQVVHTPAAHAPVAHAPVVHTPVAHTPAQASPRLEDDALAPPAIVRRPSRRAAVTGLFELPANHDARWHLGPDATIHHVLLWVAARAGHGVLQIESGGVTRHLLVHNGQLLDMRRAPELDAETLERLLAGSGRLDAQGLARVRQLGDEQSLPTADALVALDLMSPQDVAIAKRTRVLYLLSRVLSLTAGEASYHTLTRYPGTFLLQPVSLATHVFEHVRDAELDRLAAGFEELAQSFAHRQVVPVEAPLCPPERFELRGKEQRLLAALLERPRALQELYRVSPLGEQATLAAVLAAERFGLVRREKHNPFSRVHTQRVEQIELMAARLDRENHFELLGVHWSADTDEVTEAFTRAVERFDPAALPPSADAALVARVHTIRARLEAAYRTLSEPRARAAYRNTIADDFERQSAVAMFEKQADTARLRRDIPAGIDYLRRILELEPGHLQARRDLELLRSILQQQRQQ